MIHREVVVRIRKRLEDLSMPVAEAERLAGLSKNYLDDYVSGRKKSMKPEAMKALAVTLRTSEEWLILGRGAEVVVDNSASGFTSTWDEAMNVASGAKIVNVSKSEDREILVLSLNIETGECQFKDARQGAVTQSAIIFDPALKTPRNIYAHGLMSREPIKARIKRVDLEGGDERFVIVDDWDSAAKQ